MTFRLRISNENYQLRTHQSNCDNLIQEKRMKPKETRQQIQDFHVEVK